MPHQEKSRSIVSSWKDYLVQVSLILLSLFIAVGVDRCNQRQQATDRLDEYVQLIHQELADEMETTELNIVDAENDIDDLGRVLSNISSPGDDSLALTVLLTARVIGKGVFRAFPPTTFDQMVAAGDASLIKDIKLRDRLASTAAFRDDYVQADLRQFDEIVLEVIDRFYAYVDLGCIIATRGQNPLKCVTDRELLRERGAADLGKLARMAQIRTFHLQSYRASLQGTITAFEKNYGPASIPADSNLPAPPTE
ncbi:MAG: hypothetical protein AAFN92_12870 [Bacteroidota bacterium]